MEVLSGLRDMPDDEPLRGRPWRTGMAFIPSKEGSGPVTGPTGPGASPEETTARLRQAAEAKDLDRAMTFFAPDVRVYTPVTDRVRLYGREECRYLLQTIFKTISFIRYHSDIGSGAQRVVVFSAVVGGVHYEETKVLRFNERNEISEVVFFIRPLSGLIMMAAEVGPRMLRKGGRPGLALVSIPIFRLLTYSWLILDRWVAPLVGPRNAKGGPRVSRPDDGARSSPRVPPGTPASGDGLALSTRTPPARPGGRT